MQSLRLPLVSIALCSFNGEKYLTEQLESIIKQSYSNLEVVIVDDCSTDKTIDIIGKYIKADSRIRLFQNTYNIGFNKNFERAISLCNGEYIAISDQDDIWEQDKIEILLSNIGDNYLICHDSALIDESGLSKNVSTLKHHRFIKNKSEKYFLYNNSMPGHTCLIKTEFAKRIPQFPDNLYFDWWIAYSAACFQKSTFIKNKLVKHRTHNNSATSKDIRNDKERRIDTLKIFLTNPLTTNDTKCLIEKLLLGYDKLNMHKFSFTLFKQLLINFFTLFYTRKRSLYSRIKFIIKESIK